MNKNSDDRHDGYTRRDFIKTGAFLGGTAVIAAQVPWLGRFGRGGGPRYIKPTETYALAKPENIIYTACLQCQIRCLLKVKQYDGIVVKIDGSPYSPSSSCPNIAYDTLAGAGRPHRRQALLQGSGRRPDLLRPVSHPQGAEAGRPAWSGNVANDRLQRGRSTRSSTAATSSAKGRSRA